MMPEYASAPMVIPANASRLRGSSIRETAAIESRGRGVLDPRFRDAFAGMTRLGFESQLSVHAAHMDGAIRLNQFLNGDLLGRGRLSGGRFGCILRGHPGCRGVGCRAGARMVRLGSRRGVVAHLRSPSNHGATTAAMSSRQASAAQRRQTQQGGCQKRCRPARNETHSTVPCGLIKRDLRT